MVIGSLGALASDTCKLLKNVHSEAQKLKCDVDSLESFLQSSSAEASNESHPVSKKQVREAEYDAEGALDDYHLHFDDEESAGVFGLVPKKAWEIEITSQIQDVRHKIREIKIPKIKSRRGECSNNPNSSNSNQASDPWLDALFVEESELVGACLEMS